MAMGEETRPIERGAEGVRPPARSPALSRARAFREILSSLAKLGGVRGGLIVTPDGLVITSELPARSAAEPLAAVGAALGRELELGAEHLGRGEFRTALFSADDGTILVGGSLVGFLILLSDPSADIAAVRTALRQAAGRLQG